MGLGGEMMREGMAMPGNNLDNYIQNLVAMNKKQKEPASRQPWDERLPTPAKDLGYNAIPQLGYQGQTGIQLSGLTDINKAFSKTY